jgi:N,N'-diacetyllegionaminate synthase
VVPLTLFERSIGAGAPPFVIAEVGANHNGDLGLAYQLIDAARACGVDAVKFQSWSVASLCSTAEYARNGGYSEGNGDGLRAQVARYQVTPEQHADLAAYCRRVGMLFLSSVFSAAEVDLLDRLDVPAFKIASMDVTHLPLLACVARRGKPVLLSTGMATLGEIERALAVLRAEGAGPIALLHCVSEYPVSPGQVNLRNIGTLQTVFDVPVGLSDHSLGLAVPLAAVALGAALIEKHLTLDRGMPGWDHAISSDPVEMAALVQGARAVHEALGSPCRVVGEQELAKRKTFRRRLVAARPLACGAKLQVADLECKRPGTGIGPDELSYVVGRTLVRDLAADDELEWSDLA